MEKNSVKKDWLINYPKGIIKYNDILRHKLLDYDEIVEMLHKIYQENGVKTVLDLGCGTGTLIMKFEEKECYNCFGIDRSEESIEIAKKIAADKKSLVEFKAGDALNMSCGKDIDAIISMFVPFSRISQIKLLKNAHKALKKGGIISFMILQDLKDNLENDSKTILQYEEVERTKVARIEPWEKEGLFLEWNPVLIIEEDEKIRTFVDHDELEAFTEEGCLEYYKEIEELGFKIIDVTSLPGRPSAPPWTLEMIVTAIKK
ncbi:ubiquinone biosynthesis methyltransferase UbiE [Clostridium botulinum]|uniref:Class I SAM-dependent methyltransferase n=1 Tax=Clostridium botulinum TaxID=1491 RepID=A0ABD7CFA4_CLOBO|nr:class I SAM-dependent methyltransferase [Clostridium botulinum]KGO15602.1 ubiquinone biosynthesis methyltransferase UbiE [Clostridium botulinum]QRI52002.1 class I SAM-dependent methyltransferase [Clostridium botulinum]